MFSYFTSKQKTKFDLQPTYIRIQFLTKEQKIQKDIMLHDLVNDFDGDEDSVIPYQDSFKCSFRMTLNLPIAFKGKVILKDLMAHIEVTKGQIVQFLNNYVQKIITVMQNDKTLDQDELIPLYNQRDTYLYNPQQIIEIIYQKKSLWTRIKSTSKKIVANFPSYVLKFVGKLVQYFLGMLGFGSTTQILMKFVPTKVVLQWLLMFITMFFPALAPLIGIGKMIV